MSNYYASSTAFEACPAGNHGALLIRIVDIGTQVGEYKGEKTVRRQEIWTWEVPLELREDGQPFIISKFYTASLGEKSNLYKDLKNWLGKAPANDLNPQDLLGKACQIQVNMKEDTGKTSIGTVASLTKGVTLPKKPHNPLVFFSLRDGAFDQATFDGFSQGIQGMIAKSPEYAAAIAGSDPVGDMVSADGDDDEPPF